MVCGMAKGEGAGCGGGDRCLLLPVTVVCI